MSQIRLLILGVLRYRQPIHGYEVRRELETWGADRWANIAFGSIYSALNKMAEEGLVEATSEEDKKGSARTVYRMTPRGEQEFEIQLRHAWWETKTIVDPFQAAITFMDCMPHDELLAALRYRADQIRVSLQHTDYLIHNKLKIAARHTAENVRLMKAHYEAELHWIEETIPKIERNELP